MAKGVKVQVWGDYALFSRPEMKVERCSYDVMTPSAARGILEAIYWHPGYYTQALTMLDKMLTAQTGDVDIVSGATLTCEGLRDAVQDALGKAAA